MSPKIGLTAVIEKFGPAVREQYKLSAAQLKVLQLVSKCRTGQLGSHKERCTSCGHKRVHYNSCGNRHCPNCQGVNKERWLIDRSHDLLPVRYFHGVFTVPSELRVLFRYNKKLLYSLLFQCVWETISAFAMDKRQQMEAKPGVIAILHTWNQRMQYHPHIHCIIPSGGITKKGEWKTTKGKDNFLFHVTPLSTKFKKKFLHHLVLLYKTGQLSIPPNDNLWKNASCFYKTKSKLYDKDWVVYSKEAFGGPSQVMEYLGRYTHKIAISNHRILKMTDTHVTFKYLDRKAAKTRTETLKGELFILRFLQHIIPKRFIKIRHYGFLSTRSKKADLSKIRRTLNVAEKPPKQVLTTREVMIQSQGKDPYLCPKCRQDSMVVFEITAGIRGSPRPLFSKDKVIRTAIYEN